MTRREILERDMLRSAVYAYAQAFRESEIEDPLERRMEAMGVALARVRRAEREFVKDEAEQFKDLTAGELEIVELVADGLTYKQIADRIGKATSTVRTHLHNVYEKTGLPDRAVVATAFLRARSELYGEAA